MLLTSVLGLRHGWPTFPYTAPYRRASTTESQHREDKRSHERRESEPEERRHGLGFMTPFAGIVRSVGDFIASHVILLLR